MAKLIAIPTEFTQIDGRPFLSAKRGDDGKIVLLRDGKGAVKLDEQGNALVETENADFIAMLKLFLNGIFILAKNKKKEMVMEDSAQAVEIFRAINVMTDSTLELEKAPYTWLLTKLDEYGIDIYGISAAMVRDVLQEASDGQTTRAERRRQDKG